MPKKQLTSNKERRQKILRRIIYPFAALSAVAVVVVLTLLAQVFLVATDQGATGTSASSPPPAVSKTNTTKAALASASSAAPTTTVVVRTEVLETNPCSLVSSQEVFGAFRVPQSPYRRVTPESAPPYGPTQQRECEYRSLSQWVKVTTLIDDGRFLPETKASLQGEQYFWDTSDTGFVKRAGPLGDDAFRTLNTLYFKVKAVVVVITITPPAGAPSELTDHETPLLAIGKLIAQRVYTLE